MNQQLGKRGKKGSAIWKKRQKKHPGRSAERKIIFKNEESLRNILDNIKRNNIHIMRIPERERAKGLRAYLKK